MFVLIPIYFLSFIVKVSNNFYSAKSSGDYLEPVLLNVLIPFPYPS